MQMLFQMAELPVGRLAANSASEFYIWDLNKLQEPITVKLPN